MIAMKAVNSWISPIVDQAKTSTTNGELCCQPAMVCGNDLRRPGKGCNRRNNPMKGNLAHIRKRHRADSSEGTSLVSCALKGAGRGRDRNVVSDLQNSVNTTLNKVELAHLAVLPVIYHTRLPFTSPFPWLCLLSLVSQDHFHIPLHNLVMESNNSLKSRDIGIQTAIPGFINTNPHLIICRAVPWKPPEFPGWLWLHHHLCSGILAITASKFHIPTSLHSKLIPVVMPDMILLPDDIWGFYRPCEACHFHSIGTYSANNIFNSFVLFSNLTQNSHNAFLCLF